MQLLLTREPGDDITLDWDDSCVLNDDDYAIYEGTIGDFTTHAQKVCSTGGDTFDTITPGMGDRYYLVVPHDGTDEGSYGIDSDGDPRPASADACQPQAVATCS